MVKIQEDEFCRRMNLERKTQLPLAFFEDNKPTLDNFIVPADGGEEFFGVSSNRGIIEAMREVASGTGPQFLFIWGDQGAGKTHLLKALATQSERVPKFTEGASLYTVDDVQNLNDSERHQLFELYNEIRAHSGTHLVAASDRSPKDFEAEGWRQDLTSRFSWGPVFELFPLSQEDKRRIILERAANRGLTVSDEVISWMENNLPRDMHSMTTLLNNLDRYAMAAKRPITIPLIKECLSQQDDTKEK